MNDKARRSVCTVVHGDFPLDPRVAREARAAHAAGYAVDVVALRRAGEPSRELVDGIRVFRLPFSHSHGAGAARLLAEYVGFTLAAAAFVAARSTRRRYDVVHVHNPPDFLVAAALLPKLFGSRVLFDIHDLSPDMFEMRFGARRGARRIEAALRLVERAACRVSDAVITVHDQYRAELVRRGSAPDKVTVVMNTVDESVLPPPAPADRNGFRIVYHGSVTPHYGVDLLVDATARVADTLPDATLEIHGEGDYLATVRARASELGIADRVRIGDGFLPQREVLERVRGASVGVVPNRPVQLNRYALSSKLFEYVALGIPAVSADLPTIRDHFSPAEVLYFRAGDADSLARALVDVARDPHAAAARAEAAKRRYEAYRWPANAARYVEVLDRLSGTGDLSRAGARGARPTARSL